MYANLKNHLGDQVIPGGNRDCDKRLLIALQICETLSVEEVEEEGADLNSYK